MSNGGTIRSRGIIRRPGLAGGLAVASAALLALVPAAPASTYRPDKTGDNPAGGLTLREAVIRANNHAGFDGIILKRGKTYRLSIAGPGEDASATGDLDINGGSIRIQARAGEPAIVHAQGIDRVFDVGPLSAANATFKRLKIKGGRTPADTHGGGVQVQNAAAAKIVKSTISGNSARGANGIGGGINAQDVGTRLIVNRSTISNNRSGDNGGGIEVQDNASLSAINSTIAGNRADEDGGGIRFSAATASLSSVTIARNQANSDNAGGHDGGGLSQSAGAAVTVRNSVVALNTVLPGGGGTSPDCEGTFSSAGVNLFSFLDASCTGFAVPPNLVRANPKLGLLRKSSGCPTKTIKPRSGSPAINHAGSGSPTRDQCGVKRRNPDIGARERR